jgi:hypothetical protein
MRCLDGASEFDELSGRSVQAEAAPVVRLVAQSCAELIDADDTVDREIGGKDHAGNSHRLGDRFARPSKAGREELR